jgi:hypothetical protein
MKITRDVVSDLWPVYEAGEASADSRALVDEFLAGDPEFAETLRRSAITLPQTEATMTTANETLALKRTRDLVRGNGWLRGVRLFAAVMTAFALVRLLEAPAAEPKRYIGEAVTAIVAWTFYAVVLAYQRRKALGS